VIGAAANRYVRGSGSPQVAPFFHQTLLQGIRERAGSGVEVTYDDGASITSAVAAARAADVAIVSAADSEAEGTDKGCMALDCPSIGLPDLQGNDPQISIGNPDELIGAVASAQRRTTVVLQTGEPVLTPWRDRVGALLEGWYPGEAGGTAIAHVLFGDVDPGGRLPSTFPASDQDGPATSATKDQDQYPGGLLSLKEHYSEGVMVGYRWYDAKGLPVAFPFGHGLSYTSFEMSNLRATPEAATLTVRNTGGRTGWAVPQVYFAVPSTPGVPQPPAKLAGFGKVELAPGQTATVSIPFEPRSFESWSTERKEWETVAGCVGVMAGSSSRVLPLRAAIGSGGASCPRTVRRRKACHKKKKRRKAQAGAAKRRCHKKHRRGKPHRR
jgi:beta-glucosidase